MTTTALPAWNVKQIAEELLTSFSQCTTSLEASMWRTYAKKDVLRMLDGRAPTPAEVAILEQHKIFIEGAK